MTLSKLYVYYENYNQTENIHFIHFYWSNNGELVRLLIHVMILSQNRSNTNSCQTLHCLNVIMWPKVKYYVTEISPFKKCILCWMHTLYYVKCTLFTLYFMWLCFFMFGYVAVCPQSMHWAVRTKKEPMLESSKATFPNSSHDRDCTDHESPEMPSPDAVPSSSEHIA